MRHRSQVKITSPTRGLAATVLTLLVAVTGCDRLPTGESDELPAPALGLTQAPAAPGQSSVLRFTLPGTAGWVLLIDADSELAALSSGVDAIREGDDDLTTPALENLCPGEEVTESNPLPTQAVTTRSGVEQVLGGGDLFTWVYDVRGLVPAGFPDAPVQDGPFLFFDCAFLTGDAMVARGVVNSLQTVTASPTGANVVNASGTGRLEDLLGGGNVAANIKLSAVTNAVGELVRASVIVGLSPDPRFR